MFNNGQYYGVMEEGGKLFNIIVNQMKMQIILIQNFSVQKILNILGKSEKLCNFQT